MDTLFVKGECTMKKHFNKRIAGGLAIALAVTGSLSLLTPPLNSDSPKKIYRLLGKMRSKMIVH